jgi:hypothetical protein
MSEHSFTPDIPDNPLNCRVCGISATRHERTEAGADPGIPRSTLQALLADLQRLTEQRGRFRTDWEKGWSEGVLVAVRSLAAILAAEPEPK